MTSGQLYDKILASLTDEEAIDDIQQAKTEWEKVSYGQGWIDGVNSIKNSKLNKS